MSVAASSALALFDDAHLCDPYPAYAALRALGPLVRLERYGVWAVPGYAEVHAVLGNDSIFRSDGGVALTDLANRQILAGTVLASDGEQHHRLRRVLSRQLAPRAITRLQEQFTDRARTLVKQLVEPGGFDAVALAQQMVADTVMHSMGLPDSTRGTLLTGANATFDAFGPGNDRYQQALPTASAMVAFLHERVTRDSVRQGSWMGDIFRAVDKGQLDEKEAIPLASAYTAASMDTTILGLTEAIVQLARHPEQWALLRQKPERAVQAFHESLRLEAPIQGFGRIVNKDTDLSGVRIKAGEQLWMLFGSTGRDDRKWGPTADTYNLRRQLTNHHLAFGAGRHGCAGAHLAVMQAFALLGALAEHCAHLALSGEPERVLNNLLRGYKRVRVAVELSQDATAAQSAVSSRRVQ
ncbi:cytochrome P450 [Streptomyces sp. NPDC058256]|uniref:cytochrome P450 n=1 Tax=Streptomyces sp. NPDC058256 TaxID=3346408 RepID=UPI0036E1ED93